MTLDLSSLRAMRKNSAAALTKVTAELQKQESGQTNKEDTRFWKAAVDKAGNGSAVIRFLPAIVEGDLPWAKTYDHGFQGPSGKWYIEKCLTTIGQPDPCVEHCNELWATGLESDKEVARKRKRRLSYIMNVLVIKDPVNPENEGQVRLFKFGKKLFDKLIDKLQPQFEDENPVVFFDAWEGANFRLRIRKVDGYSNTDKSEFDSISVISEDDEKMLGILNQRHSLVEFTDPATFKSYDELLKKLNTVLSAPSGAAHQKANDFLLDDKPKSAEPKAPKAKAEPAAKEAAAFTADDDDMSFFQGLVDN